METRWAASNSLLAFLLVACTAPAQYNEPGPYETGGSSEGYFLGQGPASPLTAGPSLDESEALPIPPAPPADERQVVYSAAIRLVIVSVREAQSSIRALAKAAGGHLQESDARSITIRVPSAAFEDVVTKIADLGEVLENAVRAADVTEEMQDLGIRLDNLKKARERLLEHLSRSVVLEDTLKIEQELTRVSGEIEVLEGRLRYLAAQVAMSTIRVELGANQRPGDVDVLGLPFPWIARLGDGLVAGSVHDRTRKPGIFSRGPSFDPPAEFVRYYSKDKLVEAMSADGLRIKVQEQDNFDEAALDFWSRLARRSLVRMRGLAVTEERDLGRNRALLVGSREVGGETYGYMLVLARTKKHVYSFEAWGEKEAFDRQTQALVESANSLVE